MKRIIPILAVIVVYLLHQDYWFWNTAEPLVLGFLPIGLFYHVCYTLAVSVLMWGLVTYAWPGHLEELAEEAAGGDNSGDRNRRAEEVGRR